LDDAGDAVDVEHDHRNDERCPNRNPVVDLRPSVPWALAPMPMFASYGLLTAVMIAMALTASLLVLPSLLMLVTKDREAAGV